jgi:hypothetical protein
MKIVMKFLWTLVLVPLFFFIKGDLSIKSFVEINQLKAPLHEAKRAFSNVVEPEKTINIIVPVKPVSTSKNFNAHGMKVKLYDADYNLLATSQVLNGQVVFTIKDSYSLVTNMHAVAIETADELLIPNPKQIEVSLEIVEAHLNDK